MKKIRKALAIFLLTIGCLLCPVKGKVFATGRAISISPTSERIFLTPGENYHSSFLIVNPADAKSDLNYVATIGTYSIASGPDSKDDYGAADLNIVTDANEIMNWVTIDNPTGVVSPNNSKPLSYTINVPEDAPAGGQYMTILVKENLDLKAPDNGASSVSETMQMGFVIYAEVTGNTRKEGLIIENNMPSFLTSGVFEATSMVRNNGNVHTDAEYILQVWPMFGEEEICTNEESPETSLVLPETERFHMESCQLPPIGIFRAKQAVRIFGEESIVERTVIVCPIWLLFLVIFVVVALILWIVMRVRTKGKKNERRNASENTK